MFSTYKTQSFNQYLIFFGSRLFSLDYSSFISLIINLWATNAREFANYAFLRVEYKVTPLAFKVEDGFESGIPQSKSKNLT